MSNDHEQNSQKTHIYIAVIHENAIGYELNREGLRLVNDADEINSAAADAIDGWILSVGDTIRIIEEVKVESAGERGTIDTSTQQGVTPAQIERLRRDWVEFAGFEPVLIEYIKGTFYGHCSEVAAYRIERKYNCRPKCEASYSEHLGTWYVRLETNLGAVIV